MEKASTNRCTLKLIKSFQIVTEGTCMQYSQGKRVDEALSRPQANYKQEAKGKERERRKERGRQKGGNEVDFF